jgi:predicted component of type VI protein secretion system
MSELAPLNTDTFRGAAQFTLVFQSGKEKGREVAITRERALTIGRARDVDLPIEDDRSSRKHAKLFLEAGQLILEDLGSANGTFVNKEKIQRVSLNDGDRVRIGGTNFKIIAISAEPMISPRAQEWWEQTQANILTIQAKPRAPGKGRSESPALFSGSLKEISLMDMLQLLSNSTKSGVLTARCKPDVGKLFLRDGQITHATINDSTAAQPVKTVYRLLRWTTGTFEFGPLTAPPAAPEITEPTTMMLMEGARQADEIARMNVNLPPAGAKLKLAKPLPAPLKSLSPEEMDVLQLAWEQETVLAVLDQYSGSDLETYTHLASLQTRGFVALA